MDYERAEQQLLKQTMKVSEADDTAKLLHHATQEAKKQQAKKAEVEEFLGKVTL